MKNDERRAKPRPVSIVEKTGGWDDRVTPNKQTKK